MKSFKLSLAAALVALTCHHSPSTCQSPVGIEWKQVDVDGRFTILLPVDLEQTDAEGIEGFVREYTNSRVRLLIQHHPWGVLARPKGRRRGGGMRGYQEREMQVDGRRAYVQRYYSDQANEGRTHIAELTVITADWPKGIELRVTLTSSNVSELRIAERIFASIDFPSEPHRPVSNAQGTPA